MSPTLFPTKLGGVQRIDPPPPGTTSSTSTRVRAVSKRRKVTKEELRRLLHHREHHNRLEDPDEEDEDVQLEGQIGLDSELVDFIPEGTLNAGIEPEKMSIGERIVSFRQLIKRFSLFQLAGEMYETNELNPALEDLKNANVYKFGPVGIRGPVKVCDFDFSNLSYGMPQAVEQNSGGVPAITQKFPFTTDLLTNVCSIFAYTRGSIRMKFGTTSKQATNFDIDKHNLSICHLVNSNGKDLKSIQVKSSLAAMAHRAAAVIVSEDLEHVGEVQFPYYSDVVYMPKHWANFGKYNQDFGRIVANTRGDGYLVEFMMWRAAGDDFDTAFPMGVPQLQFVDLAEITP